MSEEPEDPPVSPAGVEARRRFGNARLERLIRTAHEPWGAFLLRIALSLVALFAVASLVAWIGSL